MEKCIKCGGEDIYTSYHESKYKCLYKQSYDKGNEGEHLHKTCRNCQYSWCEPTFDKRKP